jgi:hypothetical protein
MRLMMLAAAGLMLAACGQQGSGPPLPRVQQGAQAPSTQTAPSGAVRQAQISDQERQQFLQRVTQYLDMATAQLGGGAAAAPGFTDETAAMQPGSDHRWQVDLVGGTPYRLVGACDDDCANLDMELIDASTGGVVASDMLQDDFPVVDFTPQANGHYIVRLLMQSCGVAPCFAGARVLTGASRQGGDGKK